MTDALFAFWHRLRYTRLRDLVRGRLDASLDWQTVVVQSNLPPQLSAIVQHVVGRSRLWRREKLDVATELVSHFQEGLAAGRTPAELAESFGDPQTAAQLIRRAKRRGRPVFWHAWRYGWLGLAALLVFYVCAGVWMVTRRPTIKIDYLAVLNKPIKEVAENDRAWPLYRDALLAMRKPASQEITNAQADPLTQFETLDIQPGDAKWPKLETFLKEHSETMTKLREAGSRPELGFVVSTSPVDFAEKDRELFGITLSADEIERKKHETIDDRWTVWTRMPHLQQLKEAGALLAADARRAAAAGDGDVALADIRACLGVSRHAQEVPFLISTMLADALQTRTGDCIQSIFTTNPKLWSNEQLHVLAHQLAASAIDWRRGFQGEQDAFYDSMQRVYTDDGNGDGRLALQVTRDQNLFQMIESVTGGDSPNASMFANAGVAFLALPAANITIAGRRAMTDEHDRIADQALARLGAPYWTWSHEPSLEEQVKTITDGPISKFHYLFVSLLTPAYDTILDRAVTSDAKRDGVLIGLALELYHREHNKWPESLAELSPRYLPKLPVDSITGKHLLYKIVSDCPLVYSVGVDEKDDGGRTAKNIAGESHPEYAEPKHYGKDHEAVRESDTKGDWVLWSTAKVE